MIRFTHFNNYKKMESILTLVFGFSSSALIFHTFNISVTNIKSIEGIAFCYCLLFFIYVWNNLFTSQRQQKPQSKTTMDSIV